MHFLCYQCYQCLSEDGWERRSNQIGQLTQLRNERLEAISDPFHVCLTVHTPEDLTDGQSNLTVMALDEFYAIAGQFVVGVTLKHQFPQCLIHIGFELF